MGFISNTLKTIDLFGPKIGLEHEGFKRFRSTQGGWVTVFMATLCMAVFIILSKEVFERKNANINIARLQLNYSDIYLNDVPMLFTLFNNNCISI